MLPRPIPHRATAASRQCPAAKSVATSAGCGAAPRNRIPPVDLKGAITEAVGVQLGPSPRQHLRTGQRHLLWGWMHMTSPT